MPGRVSMCHSALVARSSFYESFSGVPIRDEYRIERRRYTAGGRIFWCFTFIGLLLPRHFSS